MNDLSDQRNDDGVTPDLGRTDEVETRGPVPFGADIGVDSPKPQEFANVSAYIAEIELRARLDANFRAAFAAKYPLYYNGDGGSYKFLLKECWEHAQWMEDSRRAAHPEWYQ